MANISRVPNRPDHLTGFGAETPTADTGASLLDKAKDMGSSVVEKVEDAAGAL